MAFLGKYRKGIIERFGFIDNKKIKNLSSGKIVWFHAVSVGETKAVLPLLKFFKEKHPEIKIVFSTVTQTGNKVASEQGQAWIDTLIYFPLDFYWVASRVVKKIKPKVFIVVEKEVWPNIIRILKKSQVPVVVVNGALSDRSYLRYRFFGFFFRMIFREISLFLCQTQRDGYKVAVLGVSHERIVVAGNLKFDIEPPEWNPVERDFILRQLNITDTDTVLAAGSTHAGEENIVLNVFKRLKQEFPDLKLLLAPRHPERFNEVERLIRDKGFSVIKRSQEPGVRSQKKVSRPEVILLDTMGELCNFYSIATIAFVGGTLVDVGGHNLLEPAFYKKPVIYGHYLKGYLEIAEMLETAGGGMRVNNGEELFEKMRLLLKDATIIQKAGNAAYDVVLANKGATDKCLKVLEGLMGE